MPRQRPRTCPGAEWRSDRQGHLTRLTREDLAEAHRLAVQATVLDPGATLGFNIDAFTHMHEMTHGWSASVIQSVLAAYQAATKAVALDSRDAVSQTALGCCEALMRRTDDAIARLKIAIDLNPNLTWAHGNLGLALAVAGHPEEALTPLQEAVRLSPRDQTNFLWHYLMGFVDEAKAALADFLRLTPDATVTSTKAQVPLRRPEDLERYIEALKRAGLRDG